MTGRSFDRPVRRAPPALDPVVAGVLAFALAAAPLRAQCPDGTPPPCAGAGPHVSDSLVAVFPFRTLGPSLALWREGLVDLLAANLDGLGGLRVVPPQRSIARAGRSGDDPAAAARNARELGAATYLTGSVVPTGAGRVRLIVDAYDALGARKRGDASFTIDGRESDLAGLADSATLALAARISRVPVSAGFGGQRLTPSLPALRAFLAGEQASRAARWLQAEAHYVEALGIDSSFALALYRRFQLRYLGTVTSPPDQTELIQRALALADRLPERERRLLHAVRRGHTYLDSTDLEERFDFTRRYPDVTDGLVWLAEWEWHAGQVYGEPLSRVVEAGLRAVALDSMSWTGYFHAIEAAARAGDSATAVALLHRFARLAPDHGDLAAYRWALRFRFPAASAPAIARALAAESTAAIGSDLFELLRFDPTVAAIRGSWEFCRGESWRVRAAPESRNLQARCAGVAAVTGHLATAEALIDSALRGDARNAQAVIVGALVVAAGLVPARGGFGMATAALRSATDRALERGAPDAGVIRNATLASRVDLRGGDTSAALTRSRALRARRLGSEAESLLVGYDSLVTFARVALVRCDTATAVSLLSRASGVLAEAPNDMLWTQQLDTYLLATLLVARGDVVRARAVLGRPERVFPFADGTLGFAWLLRAQLEERLGNSAGARKLYGDVVALWQDGDPEVQPYLAQARDALVRLGAPQ